MKVSPSPGTTDVPLSGVRPLLAFAFFVLAMKLLVLAKFASPLPYGDQWEAEALRLYHPWLAHQLHWSDLFAAQFEHRIFSTRVLDLFLLTINGQVWSPVLQMLANALIHVLALALLVHWLAGALAPTRQSGFLLFCAVMLAMPYGIENILWGFQSQFYFELLFSFCFLRAICVSRPLSPAWWAGLLAGVLAVLSLASGVVALLAGVLVLALRQIKAGHLAWRDMLLAGVLVLALVLVVLTTPTVAADAGARAGSLGELLLTFIAVLSWPGLPGPGLLIYLPFLLYAVRLLRGPGQPVAGDWFVFAIGLWVLGQIALLSFGRSGVIFSSRYMDVFVIGLPLNLACICRLLPGFTADNGRALWRHTARAGLLLWCVVVLGFGLPLLSHLTYFGAQVQKIEAVGSYNVRAYLQTANSDFILKASFPNIPDPDPQRLRQQLDDPLIRNILPPELWPANAARQSGLLTALTSHLLLLAVVALVCAIGCLLDAWQRAEQP